MREKRTKAFKDGLKQKRGTFFFLSLLVVGWRWMDPVPGSKTAKEEAPLQKNEKVSLKKATQRLFLLLKPRGFWAAAPKGLLTYASTTKGKFFIFFFLRPPPGI